jgi:hypothetical protein
VLGIIDVESAVEVPGCEVPCLFREENEAFFKATVEDEARERGAQLPDKASGKFYPSLVIDPAIIFSG